jgi:type 1 glutamine amidotransferase
MKRTTLAWALLSTAGCAWACSDGTGSGDTNGGAPATSAGASGTATTTGGTGTGGTGTSAGAAGVAITAGSGGQSTSGAANGGTPTTAGGTANGGTTSGGTATAGSGGSSGGSAGSGGGGNSALPKRVLLYHFSTYAIDSVPAQLTLLKNQLTTWGFESEDSVKPDDISTTNLARFGGVAMINTCFFPFGDGKTGDAQSAALKAFVEAGGGLFGTHCASVTFQSANPPNPYNVLLGGRGGKDNFDGKSACTTTAEAHVSTAMLAPTFDFTGNIDNADYVADDTKVLVKCKWSGTAPKDKETAVSWYRTPGKGRVFYTNFAKIDADLSDATLGQKHILLGLGWTLGR